MKRLLIFAFLGITSAAYAGGTVGNGGGTAEQNVMYAYYNLRTFTSMCLGTSRCGLTTDEHAKLMLIDTDIPEELKSTDQIEFRSEKADPGFFIIDGAERVAKTGSAVGGKIYVNRDLIYGKDELNNTFAFDVPAAVAMLVHEFGHHVGLSGDLVLLDLIGAKVRTLINSNSDVAWRGSPFGKRINATALELDSGLQLTLTDLETSVDVTDQIVASLPHKTCKKNAKNLPPELTVADMHWLSKTTKYDKSHAGFVMRSVLSVLCPDGANGAGYGGTFGMEITVPAKGGIEGYLMDLFDSTGLPPKIRLVNCDKSDSSLCE